MKKMVTWTSVVVLVMALVGCATQTQTGALIGSGIGAAVGAGAGQAIGRDTSSTLIGAAIGAAVGGIAGGAIGAYMDRQEQSMRQALANSEAASIQREQEVLSKAEASSTKKSLDVLTVTFKSDYLFAVNSSTLLPGAYDELERVSRVLQQYPETTIRIAGHTDSTGSESYNQNLSERRANAVKNALVGMGVNPARLTTIGYGKSKPVASNNTEGGRQQNRRVEIRIVPQQA
ncbi:OmpA family protein [Syntrophorhabdus aromaticivorans]|jgi:outer membrane protein OmpA-like peptidoglycan-associated protein|uniref:OmpA family protein n=1 Tax=Syntrophorhabdus aromaticivorans TaxID=328301 RepID=A0A351U2L1_9BACT|nr:OmpA family protein [Syntrophorhabdus aromaticivorans]NLW34896.1 OmpA family protein [Syntrophorhabdus aromaticivorans]HBA54192.1 OmpA family protein [Syntrophorhabdus aromaticivorans]